MHFLVNDTMKHAETFTIFFLIVSLYLDPLKYGFNLYT